MGHERERPGRERAARDTAPALSPRAEVLGGEGADAWRLHDAAMAARERGEDVIALSVGDPDLATPEPIVRAGIAALEAGDTGYAALLGRWPLREAVAARFVAQGGTATAEEVAIVAGAQTGLFFASMLLLAPGDEALVLTPGYVTYEATIAASGARAVAVPTPAATGFRPDPAAIEAAITPRTRAIFLANPNNPTGAVLTEAECAAIAHIAREHDLWIVSDEVYADLVFEPEHRPLASLHGMAERTVTVSSLSKSHAMTGWRIGWIIGPRALIDHAGQLALAVNYGVPGFVQAAAVEALEQNTAVAGMTARYRRRRNLLVARVGAIAGLRPVAPEAGMFVLIDVRGTGLSAPDFAWRLLREQGVAVLDAAAFGASAEGHVRLACAVDEARLEEACRRMAAFCAAHTPQGNGEMPE